MGSIVAGFTAAVDPSAAATALTGANIEAENNYLSEQKKAQKNEEIQACKSWACAATVQVKWAAIDAGQDASFYSGVVAVVPAGLYDAVLGIVQAASSPLETYAALKSLFESGDVLERVPEAIKQSYIDRITRMEEEYQRAGADGSFSAGVEGGKLIFDVVSLVTGAAGKSGIVLTERVMAKVAGNAGKVETSGGLLVKGAGKDYVDILSPEAKQHIFYGDKPGSGGHLWPGQSGKTAFPENWSAEKIVHEIGDIKTSPGTKWYAQTGTGGIHTSKGDPAKWVAYEVRDGCGCGLCISLPLGK